MRHGILVLFLGSVLALPLAAKADAPQPPDGKLTPVVKPPPPPPVHTPPQKKTNCCAGREQAQPKPPEPTR
jgi:hypothetical protein